jgi:hypothetical protein
MALRHVQTSYLLLIALGKCAGAIAPMCTIIKGLYNTICCRSTNDTQREALLATGQIVAFLPNKPINSNRDLETRLTVLLHYCCICRGCPPLLPQLSTTNLRQSTLRLDQANHGHRQWTSVR